MTTVFSQSFSVTTASANDTQYSYSSGTATPLIMDGANNTYGINALGFVAINGVQDSTTTGAVQIAYVQGLIWYAKLVNSALSWSSRSGPTGSWSTPITTSPFASEQQVFNLLTSPTPILLGQPFTVMGSLVEAANPFTSSFVYGDDGATPSISISGANGTQISFTHPGGFQPGQHSIAVMAIGTPASIGTTNLYIPIQGGTVTGLTGSSNGAGTITLRWSAVSGASSYGFMTSLDNVKWVASDQTTTALVFSMTGPASGSTFPVRTAYYFQVYPLNSNGTTGGPMNVGPFTPSGTSAVPNAPINIQATIPAFNVTPSGITVSFSDDETNQTQQTVYKISTSTSASGPWTLQQTIVSSNLNASANYLSNFIPLAS